MMTRSFFIRSFGTARYHVEIFDFLALTHHLTNSELASLFLPIARELIQTRTAIEKVIGISGSIHAANAAEIGNPLSMGVITKNEASSGRSGRGCLKLAGFLLAQPICTRSERNDADNNGFYSSALDVVSLAA
jgi:hypothetical protein